MRKILFFGLLTMLSFTVHSQEKKEKLSDIPAGYQFVKAGINFSSTSSDDSKNNNFSIIPVYGIFVAPNLSFALGVGYNSSNSKLSGTTTSDTNGVTFIGLSRQYKHVTAPFYFFLQEDIYYGTSKDKVADTKSNNFGIGISPGFNYFMSNNLSIDVTLGRLGYDTTKPDGGDSSKTIGLKLDMFSIGFGVLYSW